MFSRCASKLEKRRAFCGRPWALIAYPLCTGDARGQLSRLSLAPVDDFLKCFNICQKFGTNSFNIFAPDFVPNYEQKFGGTPAYRFQNFDAFQIFVFVRCDYNGPKPCTPAFTAAILGSITPGRAIQWPEIRQLVDFSSL